MEDCLFCKIVSGQMSSAIVFDGKDVLGFRDINPAGPTHVLLIPKKHIKDLSEIGPQHAELLAEIAVAARELAESEGIAESGYRLVANTGPNAGQSVLHLHFHLIGGRRMAWPPG